MKEAPYPLSHLDSPRPPHWLPESFYNEKGIKLRLKTFYLPFENFIHVYNVLSSTPPPLGHLQRLLELPHSVSLSVSCTLLQHILKGYS